MILKATEVLTLHQAIAKLAKHPGSPFTLQLAYNANRLNKIKADIIDNFRKDEAALLEQYALRNEAGEMVQEEGEKGLGIKLGEPELFHKALKELDEIYSEKTYEVDLLKLDSSKIDQYRGPAPEPELFTPLIDILM